MCSSDLLSGLARGDRVAASGGYLIDSEAQLKGGAGGGHAGHGEASSKERPVSEAAPVPPKKDDMNMDDMKM